MGFDQPTHWLIILLVVVLLFGYKKLPDASRSIGRSLRIFKAETKGLRSDGNDEAEAPVAPPAAIPAPAPVQPAAPVQAAAPVYAAPVVPPAPVTPAASGFPSQAANAPTAS